MRRFCSLRLAVPIVLASFVPATTAHAHAKLVSNSPSAGETVRSPVVVTLKFDDVVQPPADAIRVSGPQGNSVPVKLAQPNSKTLEGSLPRKLGMGRYTVRWRIVADDGHIRSGTFFFAVRAGARHASAAPAGPSTTSSHDGGATAVILTFLLTLVTIAALGVGLVRLRRERAAR